MNAKQLKNLQVVAEDGFTYELYRGGNPCWLMFLDGAGTPTTRRISQRTAMQDGVIDNGFRLEPRKMLLGLYIYALNEQATDLCRDKLAYIFGPSITPLKLLATRLDGSQRAIDCFLDGTLDFPQSNRMNGCQQIVVPLTAPDPTWYDPIQQVATQSLTSGAAAIDIPVTDMSAGDFPVIEITGPASDPQVLVTPLGLAITMTIIVAGETMVLDLRSGYKTIQRQSDQANRFNLLLTTGFTQFGTMRILSEKETLQLAAAPAFSHWAFLCTGGSGASSVTMRWYRRFLSL